MGKYTWQEMYDLDQQQHHTREEVLRLSENFVGTVRFADDNNPNSTVLILDRTVFDELLPESTYCLFQIFHTDVPKLSSRSHLIPVDHDDRRPVFISTSKDPYVQIAWYQKNIHLFIAVENVSVDHVCGKTILFKQFSGRTQLQLQFFHAWTCHLMRTQSQRWCTAYVLDQIKGNEQVVSRGLLTLDEFTAVVRGQITIEDCDIGERKSQEEIDGAESRDNEGNVVNSKDMVENIHKQYEKEVLRAMRCRSH